MAFFILTSNLAPHQHTKRSKAGLQSTLLTHPSSSLIPRIFSPSFLKNGFYYVLVPRNRDRLIIKVYWVKNLIHKWKFHPWLKWWMKDHRPFFPWMTFYPRSQVEISSQVASWLSTSLHNIHFLVQKSYDISQSPKWKASKLGSVYVKALSA